MLSLQPEKIVEMQIPVSTGWLLGACMEAKGKQDLWIQKKPAVLNALREQAIIQSAESSNRIEGVTVAKDRLRPIVLGRSRPRDRSEEEIVGYRKALNWIFSRKNPIPVDPAVILKLHGLAQGGFSGDAGQWKRKNNEIVEIMENGSRKVIFIPTPAKETPAAIKRLCFTCNEVCENERVPSLLCVAAFIFDFLCIHPFRDGNGRVSRLLTTFMLQQHGFVVGRYISLERLVEESKEDYYEILARCSEGWHEGANDPAPWWNYFLSILMQAYQELAQRVEAADSRSGKGEVVRQVIESQVGPFTLAELKAQCPSASVQLIKKVLSQMKDKGKVRLTGRGRGARWEKSIRH